MFSPEPVFRFFIYLTKFTLLWSQFVWNPFKNLKQIFNEGIPVFAMRSNFVVHCKKYFVFSWMLLVSGVCDRHFASSTGLRPAHSNSKLLNCLIRIYNRWCYIIANQLYHVTLPICRPALISKEKYCHWSPLFISCLSCRWTAESYDAVHFFRCSP